MMDFAAGFPSITPCEFSERRARGVQMTLVDVREPQELAIASVAGAVHVPLSELPRRAEELRGQSLVLMCHHGMRSARACAWLVRAGFEDVTNLSGGIDQWSTDVDSTVPRY